ncbi:hypothetical protein GCM10010261_20500 [Streptomyces pilosus]|uniref:hypothetical protein n=1 Tax=Streptomyces pilosus TaxID=28893 RepID=UPI00167738E4|nr:hypothetical protein [Streptomyces pilosus]GGV45886.1 hypothetical protein GCM10010261_20500 [Streptomyces pilosus]
MQPLSCRACGAGVLVEKHSLAHTSVQWHTDASGCPEFATRRAAGTVPVTGLVPTCVLLRDSIESAVRSGELAVPE